MTRKTNVVKFDTGRASGVLMHISSLPGLFGIGDLGTDAKKFADFLYRTGQTYWQILPLNPTESGSGHSPYSSISAFAGNTLFISPELLMLEGLLDLEDLESYSSASTDRVDYEYAETCKRVLLEKAFLHFKRRKKSKAANAFLRFRATEKKWLDNYALFVALKRRFNNKPWYQWPESFRDKDPRALRAFEKEHERELEKVRWEQFTFFSQWQELSDYCHGLGVKLFGDLPFYVSHDSADVWASKDIFAVDRKGNLREVAGVPPDYFNENGQLWGMPVFRWNVLKKKRYSWWIDRIRSNMSMFDLIRLDHFRAFASYWAVPGGDATAKNGKWKKGPGRDLFHSLHRALGDLPFIAEDLGDIDDAVHILRNEYGFPGMKVLQFAFGGNFPNSEYLPHHHEENFFVYTGTHDNNTSRGWYQQDANPSEKKNFERYVGTSVDTGRIHTLFIRMAFASVGKAAIIPMQDLLGLDHKSRMNSPATIERNWLWRMKPGMITSKMEQRLSDITELYGRKA